MSQPADPAMNRAARRRAASEARRAGKSVPRPSIPSNGNSGEPYYMTFNHGLDHQNISCRKITATTENPLTRTLTISSIAVEDTIHPVELSFEPPYVDLAAPGGAKGFRRMWEKLTYAFDLPDPVQFPAVPTIPAADRDALEKYVAGCRKLATYGTMSYGSGFKMESTNGLWTTTADFPDDELIVAAAARFRQLNNQGEPTAFTTASDLIIKAAKEYDPNLIQVVARWRKARAELLNKNITTIVCEMLLPDAPRPDGPPVVSDSNLRPEDLFNMYFYGDFLHVGDNAEQLIDIYSEAGNAAYHMFGFLTAMSALAHLYFGFAVLVEHALGVA